MGWKSHWKKRLMVTVMNLRYKYIIRMISILVQLYIHLNSLLPMPTYITSTLV
jgi:hypothetical protein